MYIARRLHAKAWTKARTGWRIHLAIIALILLGSIGVKSSIWRLSPQIFSDSSGYLVPAIHVLAGRGYGIQQDGFRAPTYPLFIAALLAPLDRTHLNDCTNAHRPACIGDAANYPDGQFALRIIVLAQVLSGFGTSVLLYLLGWKLTRNTGVAALFGAGYALNIATAYWELSILTETFTTFLLLLAVTMTVRINSKSRVGTFALGMNLGLLALCHQLYLAGWIVPVAFLLVREWRLGVNSLVKWIAPIFLIPVFFIGAWSTFNYFENGYFTPSTLSGYVLIQMVAPVIENAPEGYDGITQTYVGYRNAQIKQTGDYGGAIFRAWRDMMDQTDLTWSQVSAKLTTLSFYLIYHYPSVYFSSVRQVMVRFWDFAFYHYEPVPAGTAATAAVFVESAFQTVLNVLFWIAPLVLGIQSVWQAKHQKELVAWSALRDGAFLILLVWFAAIVSSLTNYQDNARLRVPVLALEYGVIVFTGWAVWHTAGNWLARFLRQAHAHSRPYK